MSKLLVKLVIAGYLLAGVILGLGNPSWFPDFYRPRLMAILVLVSIFLILLPRLIFKGSTSITKKKAVTELESVTAITLFINGLGGLGLYKLYLVGFPYDKFAHLLASFIFVITLSRFIEVWYGKATNKSVLLAGFLVILAGLGWEVIEAVSDKVLNTQLLGGGSSEIISDTVWDVVMDFFGVISGISLALFRKRRPAMELAAVTKRRVQDSNL